MEYIETLTQQPEVSKVALEKRNAIQTVIDTILSEAGEKASTEQKLNAVREYIKNVEGKEYRLEQAARKLEEYFKLEVDSEKELAARRMELEGFLPGVGERLQAANDPQFNKKDDLYKVAS